MRLSKTLLICIVGLWIVTLLPGAPAIQAAEEESPGYDTPLARYGDLELSLGYFFFYTRAANDKLRMLNRAEGPDREKLIKQALDETIYEHLLVREAEKNGFMQDNEYLTHYRDMSNDWLTRLYEYHNFYQPYKPDEEALKKIYEEKKEDFFQQEQFSFRHIFFQTVDRPEAEQKKARENANTALALIKGGSDFSEVSKIYSNSERKGNVIGPMTPSKYNPEKPLNPVLEKALLALKPGGVSEIVPTKYGYEILKLETLRPESYQPFETVKNKLVGELRSKDYAQWKKELLEKHWDEAVTAFHPEVVFQENPDPKALIFEVYGQKFDVGNYQLIKGRDSAKKPEESEEEYQQRITNFLKDSFISRYLIAKLARDLNYEKIPFFIERIKALRTYHTYMAWWNRLLAKQMDDNPNTEEELKAFYEENKSRFLKKQTARLAEMTFNLPKHDKDVLYEVKKAQDAAEAKAKKAIERVKNGEDFAAVAKEMSESETAKNGGDLGISSVESSTLPRLVATQAIRLATGAVCDEPVKNGDSYYVVTCLEKPEREPIPYDDPTVQQAVERGVTSKKRTEFQVQTIKRILDPEKIEILYDGLYSYNPANLKTPDLTPPSEKKE